MSTERTRKTLIEPLKLWREGTLQADRYAVHKNACLWRWDENLRQRIRNSPAAIRCFSPELLKDLDSYGWVVCAECEGTCVSGEDEEGMGTAVNQAQLGLLISNIQFAAFEGAFLRWNSENDWRIEFRFPGPIFNGPQRMSEVTPELLAEVKKLSEGMCQVWAEENIRQDYYRRVRASLNVAWWAWWSRQAQVKFILHYMSLEGLFRKQGGDKLVWDFDLLWDVVSRRPSRKTQSEIRAELEYLHDLRGQLVHKIDDRLSAGMTRPGTMVPPGRIVGEPELLNDLRILVDYSQSAHRVILADDSLLERFK